MLGSSAQPLLCSHASHYNLAHRRQTQLSLKQTPRTHQGQTTHLQHSHSSTTAQTGTNTTSHYCALALPMLRSCDRKPPGFSTAVLPSSTSLPLLLLSSCTARISLLVTPPITNTISRRPPLAPLPLAAAAAAPPPSPRPCSRIVNRVAGITVYSAVAAIMQHDAQSHRRRLTPATMAA